MASVAITTLFFSSGPIVVITCIFLASNLPTFLSEDINKYLSFGII